MLIISMMLIYLHEIQSTFLIRKDFSFEVVVFENHHY